VRLSTMLIYIPGDCHDARHDALSGELVDCSKDAGASEATLRSRYSYALCVVTSKTIITITSKQ
jgi:hypothetical protein